MKQKWFVVLSFGFLMFSLPVMAVDYQTEAVEKKGRVFYEKATQKPLTGTLIRKYPNGDKLAESVFVDGLLNGESRGFGADGKLAHTVQFKNNQKDGALRQYDENGVLRAEAIYKADKLQGESRLFFPSKKVRLLETYENGVLNGKRVEYYENGQIKSQAVYSDNQLNGVAKEFYEKGQLKSELPFVNGRKNGKAFSYFANGKKQFAMNFKNDILNGESLRYNDAGKLIDKRVYKNGMIVSGFTTDSGKQLPLTTEQMDELNSKSTIHTPTNTYKEKGKLYDKATKKVISGTFRVIDDKGVLREEYEFWKGLPHGVAQLFNGQGQLTQQVFFERGRNIGYRLIDATGRIAKVCTIDEKGKETCQ